MHHQILQRGADVHSMDTRYRDRSATERSPHPNPTLTLTLTLTQHPKRIGLLGSMHNTSVHVIHPGVLGKG